MRDFTKFEKIIGIEFKNKDLLKKAFVHRSYINEHPTYKLGHNERLEFLGDAVLELVVTDWLFREYPKSEEGELTNWRASLVNSHIISEMAKELGAEPYLYLSKGEAKDKLSKARHMILANVFEAIVGAIYLDQGYEACRIFIHQKLLVKFEEILDKQLFLDPKSKFQELSQEKLNITPVYKVLSEKGPDHKKEFEVGVYLDENLAGQGKGRSKQEGQLMAAEDALTKENW
ncbi:ribonuclease III [Patescibacteria group bacterium]|nr:ribonuclease III [Patescibacteria group bacterium]